MGFFSDLKEDLSQAVNEMVDEEGNAKEAGEVVEIEKAEADKLDLNELLNSITSKEEEKEEA